MTVRKVVCAAIRDPNTQIIYCGPRHFDQVMWNQLKAAGIEIALEFEQGFVDQWGYFMDRYEAMRVALNAGQKVDFGRQGNIKDHLFSEGLY